MPFANNNCLPLKGAKLTTIWEQNETIFFWGGIFLVSFVDSNTVQESGFPGLKSLNTPDNKSLLERRGEEEESCSNSYGNSCLASSLLLSSLSLAFPPPSVLPSGFDRRSSSSSELPQIFTHHTRGPPSLHRRDNDLTRLCVCVCSFDGGGGFKIVLNFRQTCMKRLRRIYETSLTFHSRIRRF